MKALAWVLCFILVTSSSPVSLAAQAITGTILGNVADASGAALRAAAVTAVNERTNLTRTTTSNDSGNYSISSLPVGVYRIEAELGGFKKEVRSGIALQVGQRARLNFVMALGQITETVNVNAEAPLIQTEDSFVGSVIDGGRITRLPLNGRQFDLLAQLLPGVAPPAFGSHLGARGGINVAGMDEHYNSFFVDGIDNVDPVIRNFSFRPSADLIQEFKVQENGGNAEFGRNAGAVINVTTKSGTNNFHGSAWEFIRNDNLDARNYFAFAGTPKPPMIRNQFGATLGGPIRKNRTFFFAGYEGLREKAGTARRASVPTALMRTGNLSELGIVITDPLTGIIFPGSVIPPERIHPLAREVIQAYPLPNLPGIRGNHVEVGSTIQDGNDASLKIDHQLLSSTLLTGRYSYSVTRVFDPFRIESGGGVNLASFGQTADRIRTNVGLGFITTRGSRFVNELRMGYNRFKQPQLPVNKGTPAQQPLMGFEKTFLGYTIAGFDPLGSGTEFNRAANVYNYIENASFTMSNHQLKAGVDVRRYLLNSYSIGPNFFIFNGLRSGSSLADFLLGAPFLSFSSTGSPGGNPRKSEIAGYLQDDWKAHPRLTLNYGLRWEYYGRIRERVNKQSLWVRECNCIVEAGKGVPEQLVENDLNNFAPRLGLAFRPFNDDRTAVRVAGGIYYDNDMRHNSEVIGNPPFLLNQQYLASLIPGLSFDNPYPANSGRPSLVPFTFDQRYRDTYAESWSLGIQQEIFHDSLVDISYVGNHVLKARRARNINQPINQVQPYPGFAAIFLFEQAGSSNFNSLQTRVERRFSRGLSFMSSYTWGHAIDDRPGQGAGRIQDVYNMRAERADSDFDLRHQWALSTVWELPIGKGRRWGAQWSRAMHMALGGWGMDAIAAIQGGRPFTVFLAQDISGSGSASDRPNLVPGVNWKPADQQPDHWINPAAFSIPAPGTFGNLGRNTLRGPQLHNVDLSLRKEERVNETVLVQLRAEFFNIFNHPNFALPNATLDASAPATSATFGVIPATVRPERQVQFGFRLEF